MAFAQPLESVRISFFVELVNIATVKPNSTAPAGFLTKAPLPGFVVGAENRPDLHEFFTKR
jgi:hypothetical protein